MKGGMPMFQRMIDDFKAKINSALRLTSLAAVAAVALLIALAFLCAAAFIFVLDKYGAVQACLAGAGLFFILTLIAAIVYIVRKRQIEAQAAARAKSAAKSMLADPAMLATAVQVIRLLGVKRLLPILALGGLAFGIMANRNQAGDQTPAE
jgi:hypothetical protein